VNSSEDGLVSVLAMGVVAFMAWNVISDGRSIESPAAHRAAAALEVPEDNVEAIAEAIAIAEGYFVEGEHDGRSLLHRLNNPGGLKKPALGADDLPTWQDTGLIIFPTPEMGWAALRHQVRVMLNGESEIYHPSDTLIAVGLKYADGDENWGTNVAINLGVSPGARLADLAEAIVTP
jgi:hypothetical protein